MKAWMKIHDVLSYIEFDIVCRIEKQLSSFQIIIKPSFWLWKMKFQYFDLGLAESEYREKFYVKKPVPNTASYFYNTKQDPHFNGIFDCAFCDGVT